MRIKSIAIAVCALLVGGWLIWMLTRGESGADRSADAENAVEDPPSVVEISQQKVQAAGIASAPAVRRMLQATETVPGRLQYDDTQHVAVTAASDATVTEMCVKPGDIVEAGDLLAVINSPQIGYARADVLRHRSAVDLAREKQGWQNAVCDGLETLVKAVNEGGDAAGILADMSEVTLGTYRADVMSAYSRYQLAQKITDNTTSIAGTGAIAGRVLDERVSERNAAQAALKAVTEQSLFEARQSRATAALEASDAEQRLRIAEQHLETLLGYPETLTPSDLLSRVEVRAPFAGTVESRVYSQTERVHMGDEMFVIADTSSLWVAADIREREWTALNIEPGQEFEVVVPALDDATLTASVYYVGREVMPSTNAVPLVGTLSNAEGRLRPGQFVRVRLPVGPVRDALAVPSSAIVAHEEQQFVFVQEGETQFRRVDVQSGLVESGESEWTEITSGLKEGDPVVIHGAFALKSQLLLEQEE